MKQLFVYGSLKPGLWAHYVIEDSARDFRKGTIDGAIYDCGEYPALRLGEMGTVKGYVCDVPDFLWDGLIAELDYFEGYPDLFDRTWRTVHVTGTHLYFSSMVYFGKDKKLFEQGTVIPSGWWV